MTFERGVLPNMTAAPKVEKRLSMHLDCRGFELTEIVNQYIDQPEFTRLARSDILSSKHRADALLQPNEGRESLGSSRPGK